MPTGTPSPGESCTLTPDPCRGCSWEREKTHHHAQDESPERDEQQEAEVADADRDGDEDVSAEPHEVTLAREEVNMLLAEQRKTVALKVGRRTGWAHVTRWCRVTDVH